MQFQDCTVYATDPNNRTRPSTWEIYDRNGFALAAVRRSPDPAYVYVRRWDTGRETREAACEIPAPSPLSRNGD